MHSQWYFLYSEVLTHKFLLEMSQVKFVLCYTLMCEIAFGDPLVVIHITNRLLYILKTDSFKALILFILICHFHSQRFTVIA